MILPIKVLLLFTFFSISMYGTEIIYTKESQYRMTSKIHLINDIEYIKDKMYQVLVEIPTGTRQKWEVVHKSGHLEWEYINAKPREVNFLAYPGNYGFIPQTRSGDGDPLDIIVLGENAQRGEILRVKVIGMLRLEDSKEEDTKILAIAEKGPFNDVIKLEDMLMKYPNVINIVKEWFEGYKGPGYMLFKGYADKKEALEHIEKAHIKWMNKKF